MSTVVPPLDELLALLLPELPLLLQPAAARATAARAAIAVVRLIYLRLPLLDGIVRLPSSALTGRPCAVTVIGCASCDTEVTHPEHVHSAANPQASACGDCHPHEEGAGRQAGLTDRQSHATVPRRP